MTRDPRLSSRLATRRRAPLNFWAALFLLGVGWNFMYVGGSALLTECHTPAERAKTQAANDFMVFLTMVVSSASPGVLLSKSGWHAVNYGSLPFLLLAAAATLWLLWRRRRARSQEPDAVTKEIRQDLQD